MLVVAGWGQKLLFQTFTEQDTRARFLQTLDDLYDMDPTIVAPETISLDLGMDFVVDPIDPHLPPITLLLKDRCLQEWKTAFKDPRSSRTNTTALDHPFLMTRDVGSSTLDLKPSHSLRHHCGQSSHKAYNLIKTLSTTMVKDLQPFGNPYFEKLGLSQSELVVWHRANRRGKTGYFFPGDVGHEEVNPDTLKGRQLACWSQCKIRLISTIRAAKHKRSYFGFCKEYRQSLATFKQQLSPDVVRFNLCQP